MAEQKNRIKFSVERSQGSPTKSLTVYEKYKSATIELSAEEAKLLSHCLTDSPCPIKDGNISFIEPNDRVYLDS